MRLFEEHHYLLMRRESRVVIGRKAVNLWLLVIVLFATFLAIAFSAGSMSYLDEKMNDPFTYWLNVFRESSGTNLSKVADGLKRDSLPHYFLFDGVQTQIATSLDMVDRNNRPCLFSIQHYEDMGSDLIKKVLSDENVIKAKGNLLTIAHDSINQRTLGVIMTFDAIKQMGYSVDDIPPFVDCRVPARQADTLGFKTHEGYMRAPLPLLAVVRRLPMNKDMLASKYLFVQYTDYNDPEPFNLSKESYARRLYFFVPSGVSDFDKEALECIPDSLRLNAVVMSTEKRVAERLQSWKEGTIKTVYPDGRPPLSAIKAIEEKILQSFGQMGVMRVYDYDESLRTLDGELGIDNGLSIHFCKLDSIRAFEHYMKENWELQIEMSQVNSKENFNAVSIMATILTLALLLFSIVSIIIFIVNMMQSYFQKVKRNMGTFKAFGISTKELIRVYLTIIVGIVLVALVMALVATWMVELALNLCGIVKEGGAPHLLLWNSNTLWAAVIILISTVGSVLVVIQRLLRHTPGDLIYDR